jgi:UDP-glucose 4-epimerase
MKSVLVTGGSGFLGSHLIDRLVERGRGTTLNFDLYPRASKPPPDERFIQGDLKNTEFVRQTLIDQGVDTVFHLAWATIHESSVKDPVADIASNLIPTVNLLNACLEARVKRFVFLSSGGQVYGIPGQTPIREDHPTRPISAYGVTKLAVEKYLGMFAHLYGLEAVVLRPSVPYGPRQNPRRRQGAVGVFIHRVLSGQPIEIWGDGETVRDYFFVDDLTSGLVTASDTRRATGAVINLGGGRGYSHKDLVRVVEETLGLRAEVKYLPARKFDVPEVILDTGRARDLLGWAPQVGLADGIRRTAAWIRHWMNGNGSETRIS